ncbi:hypothetical protein Mgra_00001254 [Meloidogyne graminicola]|uniref:Uncharacterized protein n=1 Tax=Meloidogyne graminicola TaxID=189291 RepID=A0A8T0A2N5_9BILA|nr:hypothetical protein Mgra_00001254 [Meloidogyne graminicola]
MLSLKLHYGIVILFYLIVLIQAGVQIVPGNDGEAHPQEDESNTVNYMPRTDIKYSVHCTIKELPSNKKSAKKEEYLKKMNLVQKILENNMEEVEKEIKKIKSLNSNSYSINYNDYINWINFKDHVGSYSVINLKKATQELTIADNIYIEEILFVREMCSEISYYFEKKYYKFCENYCKDNQIENKVDKIISILDDNFPLKYQPCKYEINAENEEKDKELTEEEEKEITIFNEPIQFPKHPRPEGKLEHLFKHVKGGIPPILHIKHGGHNRYKLLQKVH